MPASLLEDMNSPQPGGGGLIQDQRALQIALELSMLGLNGADPHGEDGGGSPPAAPTAPNSSSSGSFEDGHKLKRSANMTECVPVPSSEHVAEIVGRQGGFSWIFRRGIGDF